MKKVFFSILLFIIIFMCYPIVSNANVDLLVYEITENFSSNVYKVISEGIQIYKVERYVYSDHPGMELDYLEITAAESSISVPVGEDVSVDCQLLSQYFIYAEVDDDGEVIEEYWSLSDDEIETWYLIKYNGERYLMKGDNINKIRTATFQDLYTEVSGFTQTTMYAKDENANVYAFDSQRGEMVIVTGIGNDFVAQLLKKYKSNKDGSIWYKIPTIDSLYTGDYFVKEDELANIPQDNASINDFNPTTNPNIYKPGTVSKTENTKLISKAGKILGIVRNLGVAFGVIALSAIGLRYMFASIEEKAEYKETMMPFVIGAILLMGGTILVNFIYSVAIKF